MPDTAPLPASPRIGLALGGGGARGLAHIHAIEALDDLGLKPAAIAGTSIGAIMGAGAATGLSGKEIREATIAALRNQAEVWGRLWQLRPKRLQDYFGGGIVQFDAERVLEVFLPPSIPADFSALKIPLTLVAADYYGCSEVALTSGPLKKAIAASIALPIVFRPVEIGGVCMIDGGVVNPLPFDKLPADMDLVIALDVVGGPVRVPGRAYPSAIESMFGASQILMESVISEKLKSRRPDVLVQPPVDAFRVLDFLKANAIIRSTASVRDEVKRQVEAALEGRLVQREI